MVTKVLRTIIPLPRYLPSLKSQLKKRVSLSNQENTSCPSRGKISQLKQRSLWQLGGNAKQILQQCQKPLLAQGQSRSQLQEFSLIKILTRLASVIISKESVRFRVSERHQPNKMSRLPKCLNPPSNLSQCRIRHELSFLKNSNAK